MPNPEFPPVPEPLPQSQEVAVDANIVIQVQRNQISDLQWQNALLQAQLITARTAKEGQEKPKNV